MAQPNLNICKYTPACSMYDLNRRLNFLFQEVCSLKANPNYVLPIATDVLLGGIKVGAGLTINSTTGVLSVITGDSKIWHYAVTSEDFEVDGVTYLNDALVDDNTSIFWNDINRFIYEAQGEWEYVEGGIRILMDGFDANVYGYNLEIIMK